MQSFSLFSLTFQMHMVHIDPADCIETINTKADPSTSFGAENASHFDQDNSSVADQSFKAGNIGCSM